MNQQQRQLSQQLDVPHNKHVAGQPPFGKLKQILVQPLGERRGGDKS